MRRVIWTKKKIIKAIHEVIKLYGPIKKYEMYNIHKKYNICHYSTIKNFFGSLDGFAQEANFKFVKTKQSKKWTKEEIIKCVHNIIAIYGSITKNDLKFLHNTYNICSKSTIIVKFKSLNNFAQEANFKFIKIQKWQKEKIIKNIHKIINKIGPIKKSDLNYLCKKYNIPHTNTIIKIFGTLDYFAQEANIIFIETNQSKEWPKEKIKKKFIKLIKKHPKIKKTDINKFKEDICNRSTIIRHFGSLDELANECNFKFQSSWSNRKVRYGKHEKEILDYIEKNNDIKLERQFPVQYQNKHYFLDGYDFINKVPYEVDEQHHKHHQVEDFIREQNVITSLGCKSFIRINEQDFLQSLNKKKIIILEDF